MANRSNFVVPLRCAVHDKDFIVSFRTNQFQPDKLYFNGVEKVERGAAGPVTEEIDVAASTMPWDKARCPYCAASLFVRCGGCLAFVCRGRVSGNFFRCSDKCGQSGYMQPTDITVTARRGEDTASRLHLSSRTLPVNATTAERPRLTGPRKLFLPPPKGWRE